MSASPPASTVLVAGTPQLPQMPSVQLLSAPHAISDGDSAPECVLTPTAQCSRPPACPPPRAAAASPQSRAPHRVTRLSMAVLSGGPVSSPGRGRPRVASPLDPHRGCAICHVLQVTRCPLPWGPPADVGCPCCPLLAVLRSVIYRRPCELLSRMSGPQCRAGDLSILSRAGRAACRWGWPPIQRATAVPTLRSLARATGLQPGGPRLRHRPPHEPAPGAPGERVSG